MIAKAMTKFLVKRSFDPCRRGGRSAGWVMRVPRAGEDGSRAGDAVRALRGRGVTKGSVQPRRKAQIRGEHPRITEGAERPAPPEIECLPLRHRELPGRNEGAR